MLGKGPRGWGGKGWGEGDCETFWGGQIRGPVVVWWNFDKAFDTSKREGEK